MILTVGGDAHCAQSNAKFVFGPEPTWIGGTQGLILGDSAQNYRPEEIFEAYCSVQILKGIAISPDFQMPGIRATITTAAQCQSTPFACASNTDPTKGYCSGALSGGGRRAHR